MNRLKPAYECAKQYGVKMLIHGGSGTGKTPLVKTLPRPVLCACEPGLLSLRDWNGPVWEAYTASAIDEFFAWVQSSNEANNFDTVVVDSVSQMAEIYLAKALKTNKHGLQAYGDMALAVMKHLGSPGDVEGKPQGLYYMKNKHVYLTAKQYDPDDGSGIRKKRPYFPGNALNTQVPYLYDEILAIGHHQPPGQKTQKVIFTQDSLTISARDRSGRLNEYEPCDLSVIISKCMSTN